MKTYQRTIKQVIEKIIYNIPGDQLLEQPEGIYENQDLPENKLILIKNPNYNEKIMLELKCDGELIGSWNSKSSIRPSSTSKYRRVYNAKVFLDIE